MSDPRVVARSPVDEATTAGLALPDLPRELILRIASLLEIRDILALRRVRFTPGKPKPPASLPGPTRPKNPCIVLVRTNSSGGAYSATSTRHYNEL